MPSGGLCSARRVGGGRRLAAKARPLAGVVEATDHIPAVIGVPDAAGADAIAAVVAVVIAVIVAGAVTVAVAVARAGQGGAEREACQARADTPAVPSSAAETAATETTAATTVPAATAAAVEAAAAMAAACLC